MAESALLESERIRTLERHVAELRAVVGQQEALLAQRAALLDEVNHRAKNNLQLAIAMLDMQARGHDDARVSDALGDAIRRLGQLARVHEMLYRHATDAQTVDVAAYLGELCATLQAANDHRGLHIFADCAPLTLDSGRAISLALIAGEAVINAIKHAFPDDRDGQIGVTLARAREGWRLTIADDGVGAPPAPNPAEPGKGSRGMRLMRALARTVGGTVAMEGGSGTCVIVDFRV